MSDSTSLVADKGGEPAGESICVATVEAVDSIVVVAINSTSEPSCISSLSTRGEEAECAAEVEGRVPETDRRSPELPTGPTPKLRQSSSAAYRPPLHLRSCWKAYTALNLGANDT